MAPSPPPDPVTRVGPPPDPADDADPHGPPGIPVAPDAGGRTSAGVAGLWRMWEEAAAERGLDPRLPLWLVAALAAAAAGWWLLRPAPAPVEELLPVASTEAPAETASGETSTSDAGDGADDPETTVPETVVAHAAGAVTAPGVYELDGGARIDDLVAAAGGLAPDADGSRVNLAAPLVDGAWIYVPRVGEEAPPDPSSPVAPPGAGGDAGGEEPGDAGGSSGGDLINLNTADEAELDELPGVGPTIAAAIVSHREEVGGFTSVDDLLDVRGIGEAKLEDIRPLATV